MSVGVELALEWTWKKGAPRRWTIGPQLERFCIAKQIGKHDCDNQKELDPIMSQVRSSKPSHKLLNSDVT